MSRGARTFVWVVITCGFAGAAASAPLIRIDSPAIYAAVAAVTLLAAIFKVNLSRAGNGASVSAATGGVFFALLRFGAPEALPIAMASVWAQECLRVTKRNPPLRTTFSMAVVALSVLGAGLVLGGLATLLPGVAAAGPIAAAASMYFAINSLLVAGAVGLTRGEPPLRYWRETCLLAAPYFFLSAFGGAAAAVVVDRPREGALAALLGVPVYLAYRGFRTYLRQLHDRQRDTEAALDEGLRITEALTLAITAQDGASHENLRRLQHFGQRLAAVSGLDDEHQRGVAMAVLLRNIGLLTLPRDLPLRPDPPTPDEAAQLQAHPRLSVALLAPARLPAHVREAIETHHECWDGTGYPSRLSGRDIPVTGRIVGLLDFYDGIVHARGSQAPHGVDEVVARLKAEAGRRIDPVLTGAFIEVLQQASGGVPGPVARCTPDVDDLALRSRDLALDCIARSARERELMYGVAEALGSGLGLADGVRVVAKIIGQVVPFSHCCLILDEPFAGTTRVDIHADGPTGDGLHLVAPLTDTGASVGTLTLFREDHDAFDAPDIQLVQRVADMLAKKVTDARRFEAVARDVQVDPLTGLANSRGIEEAGTRELERTRREAVPTSVMLVDVEGFTSINETFGYGVGDRVLRLVAQTLRESVRPYDSCARIGGDEFLVLFPRCPAAAAAARCRDLIERLSGLVVGTASGTVSIAVTAATATYPDDGDDFQAVMKAALAVVSEPRAAAPPSAGHAA